MMRDSVNRAVIVTVQGSMGKKREEVGLWWLMDMGTGL